MKISKQKACVEMARKSLRQTDVADKAQISRATYNAVLNGKSCRVETAKKIADALGVNIEKIVETW